MNGMMIREADKVEIVVLVDNYSDFFLPDSDVVKRLRVLPPGGPLSEPGLSYLLKVSSGLETHTLLFDTGISGTCLLHNAETFASSRAVLMGEIGADFKDIEAVILSHGHFDHFGGLPGFLGQAKKEMPLFVHPSAFAPRRFQVSPEFRIDMPGMDETALARAGAELQKIEGAPMHCTGWKAINRFAQEMPENFILNSVGTTYIFQ